MKGRALIFAAVALELIVVGCVVWPGGSSAAKPADAERAGPAPAPRHAKMDGLPLRGITVQVQRVEDFERYKTCIDEVATTGADTVQIVVSARQENGSSSKIFLDFRKTLPGEKLGELIDRAKSLNLRVQLMPIVLLEAPQGLEWRGTIKPVWPEWFESYREMIGYYAQLAERHKVDVFIVGSELVSTETQAAEWDKTIAMVRGHFSGLLTYSANWDHYANIPFWEKLDIIGMNSYWKMGENRDVSVAEVQARWKEIQKDLVAFSNKKNKPIVLVEVGWCSVANAAHEPWDYTKMEEPIDLELQRKLYEGFFTSWYGSPNLAGFMIWEWSPGPGGPADRNYSPEGKPAEKVLRDWLAKGPWEVK